MSNENKRGFGDESQKRTIASRAVSVPSITLSGEISVSVRRHSRGLIRQADPVLKGRREDGPAKDGVLRVEMRLLRVCTFEAVFDQMRLFHRNRGKRRSTRQYAPRHVQVMKNWDLQETLGISTILKASS